MNNRLLIIIVRFLHVLFHYKNNIYYPKIDNLRLMDIVQHCSLSLLMISTTVHTVFTPLSRFNLGSSGVQLEFNWG